MRQALVTLIAVGLLTHAACFRDRAADGGGTVENKVPRAKWPSIATDPLAFLPVESEIVFGLELQQVFQSPLWKRFEPQLMQRIGSEMKEFHAACGFDPFATVKSLTMGVKTGPGDAIEGVFVLRGIDRDKSMACLEKVFATGGRKVTVEGGYLMIPPKGSDPAGIMTFVDGSTAVFAIGALAQRPRFEAALGAGVPLRKNLTFPDLFNTVDSKGTLWVVMNGNAKAFDSFAAIFGGRPRAMLGSLSLANGLSASGRVRLASADQATQLANTFRGQIGPFKAMVDELDIGSDGADLTLRVAMNQQQVDSLLQLAGGALGGSMIGPIGP